MKILLVSVAPLRKELGASKVIIEVAEELERLGWQCTLVSVPDLLERSPAIDAGDPLGSAKALRAYLQAHAAEYDVVDYPLGYLPFPRGEFPARTLFVGRSVLLIHHFSEIELRTYPSLKARAHALVYGRRLRAEHRETVARADATIAGADLVNVSNDDDLAILRRHGVPEEKIAVLPYGLSREAAASFERAPRPEAPPPTAAPTVAFVGTFDSRKGAADFPTLARRIVAGVPEARFLLLGTYRGEAEVRSRFPRALRSRLTVIPHYSTDKLPELLSGSSIGVFPSSIEGFGFGVLELLAAGLPVIAYAAPGPPMMLPPRYLAPIGDARGMGDKVVELLKDAPALAAAGAWARERSRAFHWDAIGRATSEVYLERLERQRRQTPPPASG